MLKIRDICELVLLFLAMPFMALFSATVSGSIMICSIFGSMKGYFIQKDKDRRIREYGKLLEPVIGLHYESAQAKLVLDAINWKQYRFKPAADADGNLTGGLTEGGLPWICIEDRIMVYRYSPLSKEEIYRKINEGRWDGITQIERHAIPRTTKL